MTKHTTAVDPLAVEKAYVRKHLQVIQQEHSGNFALVKGQTLAGVYETHEQAVRDGVKAFGRGPFLVFDLNKPEDDVYTVPALAAGVPLVASH